MGALPASAGLLPGHLEAFSSRSAASSVCDWAFVVVLSCAVVGDQLELRKCRMVLDSSVNFPAKSEIFIHTHFYQLSSRVSAETVFFPLHIRCS